MVKKPEVLVFAGPNGSGKSTITKMANIVGIYVNADNIKMDIHCSDLEAAKIAESLRNDCVSRNQNFTFETVLSTRRNLELLIRAKENGYFIRVIYVLTYDSKINIARVISRVDSGGHNVPKDKIVTRYNRALALLPEVIQVSDICHIYDNSDTPFRIFKKRKDVCFYWENQFWSKQKIENLTGMRFN